MATTLPLVLLVLATTGLGMMVLLGFAYNDWQSYRQVLDAAIKAESKTATPVVTVKAEEQALLKAA